jgi:class 3 adenylate cyclase/tetratricopeptide (TPR) repeat protein/ribosomal protein L40E
MQCTKCDFENPADALFCIKCGAKIENLCAACQTINPLDANFCKRCGAVLRPAAGAVPPRIVAPASTLGAEGVLSRESSDALDGERKTVTALFADIKGSMELMEDLDPEAARAIVDPALKLMIDAVHRYGGYVVQSTGDGIFALFGAPLAHEDHPQRALYAALRMQEELRRFSAKVVAEGGSPIQCRVGANTGEVVVRTIATSEGHTEYTPIGHTTNLASRMQAVAPVGSIAVTDTTRHWCEGYFAFNSLGPTRLRGVQAPIEVHEVTGLGPLRTRLQRAVGRGLTRFVGREREMEAMKHAAELARSGQGQIVAAMAEPGAGKSRLLYEFRLTAQLGWMVLEGYSVSYGKASAYLPVIDLLQGYFDIEAQDAERKRREKINGKIVTLDHTLADTVPYLSFLLGLSSGDDTTARMDAPVRKRRTHEAIKRILLRESLNQPLMVIFEDLHWIDAETQDLLNLLATVIGTSPILLLVNYRPEYSHHWSNKTYYTQLRLDPLGHESAEEMLGALVGSDDVLAPLRRLIIEKTEGNPFFMEETLQALFDEGALSRNGGVKLARPLSELKIPPTVQAMLASRIDRLPSGDKDLLQTLAVLGRDFSFGLVTKTAQDNSAEEITLMLDRLQLGEFIYERPAAGDIEYTFKHALTQEVAYNSLLIDRRKALHEHAARAMEQIHDGNLDEHLDEIARHYSRSGNIAKSVEYLRRAGERALSRSLYADARASFETAVGLVDVSSDLREQPREKLRLLNLLLSTLYAVEGRFTGPTVEDVLTRARKLIPLVNDAAILQATLLDEWVFTLNMGKIAEGRLLIDRMIEQAARSGLPALIALTHFPAANNYFHLAEFEKAARYGQEGTRLWRPEYYDPAYWQGDPRVFGLTYRGRALATMGYPDKGLDCIRQALTIGKHEPSKFSYLALLWDQACWLGTLMSDPRSSLSMVQEAMRVAEEIEYAERNVVEACAAWPRAVTSGVYKDSIETLEWLVGFEKDRGQFLFAYYHLVQLADLCLRTQLARRGLAAVAEALSFAGSSGARYNLAELWRLHGELLLLPELGDQAGAARAFEHAIEIGRDQDAKWWELRATASLARLLAKHGKRDQARERFGEIYNWFTEGFDTADLKEAKALLDELSA